MFCGRQPYGTLPFFDKTYDIQVRVSEELRALPVKEAFPRFPRITCGIQPYGRIIEMPPKEAARLNVNIHVAGSLREDLAGSAKVASGKHASASLSESLGGNASLNRNRCVTETLLESLSGNAKLLRNHCVSEHLAETLDSTGYLSKHIYPTAKLHEQLDGSGYLSKNIYIVSSLGEAFTGSAYLSKNIYPQVSLYEILAGYADARTLREYTAEFLYDIPAGAELIIDSKNYAATLRQGENITDVIHWHKGDWLQIGRETVNLTVSGIGSNYNWEVFYHALYL